MAKTRTWSVPTSPRNPYKMCDELGLLKKYEGRVWNKDTQTEFALELAASDFFEGAVSAKEPDFSARDRINRSPKTFGFIRMDDERKIRFTPAGNQLITKKGLEDLFLRQLLKWQYPSPKHKDADYQTFRIKPFREVLRLIRDLEGLSKKEIAIFCVPMTEYSDFESTKEAVLAYRKQYQNIMGKRDRQIFERDTHLSAFRKIYQDDIESGEITVREGISENQDVEKFLKTKMRNSIDYADAAMRYFRASGLFSLSSRNFRLKLLDNKVAFVDQLLATTEPEPQPFEDTSTYLDFLGDNTVPILPDDNEKELRRIISETRNRIIDQFGAVPQEFNEEQILKMKFIELKEVKIQLEEFERDATVEAQKFQLQTYEDFADVIETFEKIGDRKDTDIPDKPLFFEWNVWRTMTMLDDGDIRANLRFDVEGKPFSGAPSKTADIVCEYEKFVLVVEVTLMSGHKQYEAEGEPVARHVADIKKRLEAEGDKRSVFGLFVALKVSEATIAHFFALKQINIAFYGGKLDIVPMDLKDLTTILERAKNCGGTNSEHLFSLISGASSAASSVSDEQQWMERVSSMTRNWSPATGC